MLNWLQHRLNPLHIACRLCDLGLSRKLSMRLGGAISGLFRPFIYRRKCHGR